MILSSRETLPAIFLENDGCNMEERVIESIREADKILVGIGENFQEKYEVLNTDEFLQMEKEESLKAGFQKIKYIKELKEDQVIGAYKNLGELLKDKDYYLVTTCTDDKIYEAGLQKDRIVTPCGGFRYLQCYNNCSQELLTVTDSMIESEEELICPKCGEKMCFNQLPLENYNENGYLEEWQKYNKWLQGTLNHKLCIIELGVGLKYPSVIRWPFEKIAFYNKKAIMYRIHESLYQSTSELKEKCVPIKSNPIFFLNK